MGNEQSLPQALQDALNKGLLKRLPLTFLPFVNQQLNQWDYLFPNERQSVERLLLFVADLTPDQSTSLFRNVVELEDKMGVRNWQFSTNEQTIQNSSLLAASPYFQEWRRAVQAVFDAADAHARARRIVPAQSSAGLFCSISPWISPSMRQACGADGGESAVQSSWISRIGNREHRLRELC